MSHVSFVIRARVGKEVTISNRAASLIPIVNVVGGDVAAWGYMTKGVRVGT
jgi:hypothetical protein